VTEIECIASGYNACVIAILKKPIL
jgi:hypothetical protein